MAAAIISDKDDHGVVHISLPCKDLRIVCRGDLLYFAPVHLSIQRTSLQLEIDFEHLYVLTHKG